MVSFGGGQELVIGVLKTTASKQPMNLCNMSVSIEQHVEWISDCLKYMLEHHFTSTEPRVEAENTCFSVGFDQPIQVTFDNYLNRGKASLSSGEVNLFQAHERGDENDEQTSCGSRNPADA